MTDMMGKVRLGLWADDVGNEPFKAEVGWDWEDRRKSVLQVIFFVYLKPEFPLKHFFA